MIIGIDLSPLQGPHRMRGIGYTLINFLNSLSRDVKQNNKFVFFLLEEEYAMFKDPLELIDTDGLNFELRPMRPQHRLKLKLPWKFTLFISLLNQLLVMRDYYYGDSRIKSLEGLDTFMQFDQSQCLPKDGKASRVLVLYDLIPYVLEGDYLWSYKTARFNGRSRKGATKKQLLRYLYIKKLRINTRRADNLIAISQTTKDDFVKYASVEPDKISIVPLGVVVPDNGASPKKLSLKSYENTSWGYVKRPLQLNSPYILFVGGTDPRRKLEDVVAAFNLLRAQGEDIKLVLAGDIMLGPKAITNEIVSKALSRSSYLDDIIFMGFVDDSTRDWLYRNALAFIFPSKYEGFGLPVLEAMSFGTPVISYRNRATVEVAHDIPLYADDIQGLAASISKINDWGEKDIVSMRDRSLSQAKKFKWSDFSQKLLSIIGS